MPGPKKTTQKPTKVKRQIFSTPYKAPWEASNVTDSANKETSGKVNAKSKKSIVCETESDPVAIIPESESETA